MRGEGVSFHNFAFVGFTPTLLWSGHRYTASDHIPLLCVQDLLQDVAIERHTYAIAMILLPFVVIVQVHAFVFVVVVVNIFFKIAVLNGLVLLFINFYNAFYKRYRL